MPKLIQTPSAVHVVEIKRKKEIGDEVVSEMKEKLRRLKVMRGMSVRTALVYDGMLTKSVRASGFFDAIVSADMLLGIPPCACS